MRPAKSTAVVGALLALAVAAPQAAASVVRATYTSCMDSYSPAAPVGEQLNVTDVLAQIVTADGSKALGLVGSGEEVLRLDVFGTAAQNMSGYNSKLERLATLFTVTTEAGVKQYTTSSWLCNSIFPAQLPSPYFPGNTTYCPMPAGHFGLNVSVPMYNIHALTTSHTQVRAVDASEPPQFIMCLDILVTPYKKNSWPYQLFLWFPAAIAIAYWITTWAARFAAGWVVGVDRSSMGRREVTLLKWGTMLISGLSGERLGVSTALLRFVTPGLRDIMFHIQFVTMLGMIAVNWPPFFYTVVGQSAWADLVWNVSIVSHQHPNTYPSNYTAPVDFNMQLSDPLYPLYLNASGPDLLLDMDQTPKGIASFARVVGLRPQDLFGTCLSLFLILTAVIVVVSLVLWLIHSLTELFGHDGSRRNANNTRGGGSTVPRSAGTGGGGGPGHSRSSSNILNGGKESYDPRGSVEFGQLPLTPSSQLQTQQRKPVTAPTTRSKFLRIWNRFTPKGEAGAFHFAALYGNLFRLILTFHFPITCFSVYQLTLTTASIVSRVFAALAFVFISIVIPAVIIYKVHRTPTGKLYDAARTLLALGTFYNVYTPEKQLYRTLPLIGSLVQGIVMGAGQSSGLAQTLVLGAVELLTFVTTTFWNPWGDGASMAAQVIGISILRITSIIMAMVLSDEISVDETPQMWLTYVILIIQAIIFVYFFLMVCTKITEGLIRLFGGAPFDESTHPIDGGIFAAIMDLDYFNGVRGGKAAQRKQRKRDSRQLQRNVSVAGSLTTQMMLDRHSQGVTREGYRMGYYPVQNPSGDRIEEFRSSVRSVDEYGQQRSMSDHASMSSSDDTHTRIMDGWQPNRVYGSQGSSMDPFNGSKRSSWGGPPPSIRVTDGERPGGHQRARSSGAVMDSLGSPTTPPLRSLSTSPNHPGYLFPSSQYPPTGGAIDRNGIRPPPLSIPRRRSLNNINAAAEDDTNRGDKQASKRRSWGSSNWFGRSNAPAGGGEDDYSSGSDDEPGPSRQSRRRRGANNRDSVRSSVMLRTGAGGHVSAPAPPLSAGWGALFTRRTRVKSAREKDENAARKMVAVNESGAALVGVATPAVMGPVGGGAGPSAPPITSSHGFRVQRKTGHSQRPPSGGHRPSDSSSAAAPLLAPPPPSSFRVRRGGPLGGIVPPSGTGAGDRSTTASQMSQASHYSQGTTPTPSLPGSPAPDVPLQHAEPLTGFAVRRSGRDGRPSPSGSGMSSPTPNYLATVPEPHEMGMGDLGLGGHHYHYRRHSQGFNNNDSGYGSYDSYSPGSAGAAQLPPVQHVAAQQSPNVRDSVASTGSNTGGYAAELFRPLDADTPGRAF